MLLDQIYEKLNLLENKSNSITVTQVFNDLQKIVTVSAFLQKNTDTIVICENLEEANNFYNLAKNLFNVNNTFLFPDFNIEPYTTAKADQSVINNRIDTLYSIINIKEPKLVITTTLSYIFKTVSPNNLKNKQLHLTVGKNISIEDTIQFLTKNGYVKKDRVTFQGEFSLRGDIIDIYSSTNKPVRVSFFDNIVESIKTFDIFSQITQEKISSTTISVPLELILTSETVTNFRNNYKKHFLKNLGDQLINKDNNLELINQGNLPLGGEHYLPLFFKETATIHNYLNKPNVIFLNTSLLNIDNIWQIYKDSYAARVNSNLLSNNKYNLLQPEELLISKSEVQELLKSSFNLTITNNTYPEEQEDNKLISLESKSTDLLFVGNSNIKEKSKKLLSIMNSNKDSTFIINLINKNSEILITSLLVENNINYSKIKSFSKLNQKDKINNVFVINNPELTSGFIFKNYIVICEHELFSNHIKRHAVNKRKRAKFLSIKDFQANQLVVHNKYGIGKYIGLTTLNHQGVEHDFLAIEYSEGDKLYLPVENIDLLSNYSSDSNGALLDKLGSSAWERRKAAIKEKLHEIAYDLVKLAAVRNIKEGPKIDPSPEGYLEFANAFPYIETEDQIKAIEDIRTDFSNNKIIDRLVCGDVGFGKTEIAMRAAFLAASSGYQVAIIAPTTLLVRQHYHNFLKRFKGFPFVIEQLSRFITTKNKVEIKHNMQEGKVDIVIATHALLAKDVAFSNLGLLIIDEEQNFGVVHKEKIKTLKDDIHTINLTATPIPRTLQMSLTGVKSLSIIATPPVDKLPIKTYVMPFDEIIIKEAILRETKRNGQIFFVAPYIKDLKELEQVLLELVPDLKVLMLHGQMQSEQIENYMKDFQDKNYNILLSTNIIESGIDLDNVNTIIIKSADKFGLSQLYQLRGRVGRGMVQSFAYITYSGVHQLTTDAKKRLEVIQNLNYLGAGFTLAEHDLDIRGAGNILGKEQSGHIKGIGVELYNKFLSEEINKLKLKANIANVSYDGLSPNITLPIPALITGTYINDINTRMEFYQKLANVASFSEIEEITDELTDRFGKLPDQVKNLITLIKIKVFSKNLGIEKLTAGSKGVCLNFYQNKPLNTEGLLLFVQQNSKTVRIQKDSSVVMSFISNCIEGQIKEIFTLFYNLKNIFELDTFKNIV